MVIINNTQQRYSTEVQTAIRDELEKEKKRQDKKKKRGLFLPFKSITQKQRK